MRAPAVAVHAITIDSKYGVPTVAIHTNVFEKVVQSVTQLHGMPQARYTFVPQPVMGKTAAQLRADAPPSADRTSCAQQPGLAHAGDALHHDHGTALTGDEGVHDPPLRGERGQQARDRGEGALGRLPQRQGPRKD